MQIQHSCFTPCFCCCCLFTQSCLTLIIPVSVAWQTPLSIGFSRQEYWSGLPFLSPEDLIEPGTEPASPALQEDSLPLRDQGSSPASVAVPKSQLMLPILASQVAQWYRICLQSRRYRFSPWVGMIPWRRKRHLTPVFLPGKSYGQRSLPGYSPQGLKRDKHDLVTK